MRSDARPSFGRGNDDRPRIYLRATGNATVSWQIGPHGRPRYSGDAGTAVNEALAAHQFKPLVIFWEGGPFE